MEFKDGLTGFTDDRKDSNIVFLNQNSWRNIIEKAGLELFYTYPQKNDILEKGGQAAYIARIRYNQKQIDKQDIIQEQPVHIQCRDYRNL